MNTRIEDSNGKGNLMPARGGGWPRWAPYAAVAWSLIYAALGVYWAVSGSGFPYAPVLAPNFPGPLAGRFGQTPAWAIVITAGIPAAALGAAMLSRCPRILGVRALRPLFITAGGLITAVLLLLMTDMMLLIMFGYTAYGVFAIIKGDPFGQTFLKGLTEWPLLHQLLCFTGGFLWLGATISYARRSGAACQHCGRRDGPAGWTSPDNARRWGRIAVAVAMVAPLFYALTRYAWALGIPLGMTDERLRVGQEAGIWISGLFLATFGLVGALLMLGLVQRWGEVFPRWMIGLAGRRVPIALAVVPAAVVAVLLVVGGISIWSGYNQMAVNAAATGEDAWIVVGPTLLFPLWGAALAAATLSYYFRRRVPCSVCGRGAPDTAGAMSASHKHSGEHLPVAG
jgi:hypothetical protein